MKTVLPIEILPIEDDGFHLKIVIKINGKDAAMILDTGASRSVFDENRILNFIGEDRLEDQDKLSSGLGTTTMKSKKVTLQKLKLGELKINNYEAAIIDLSHINQSYEKIGLSPVDGVLGSDILIDYNALIDYKKQELTLKS